MLNGGFDVVSGGFATLRCNQRRGSLAPLGGGGPTRTRRTSCLSRQRSRSIPDLPRRPLHPTSQQRLPGEVQDLGLTSHCIEFS